MGLNVDPNFAAVAEIAGPNGVTATASGRKARTDMSFLNGYFAKAKNFSLHGNTAVGATMSTSPTPYRGKDFVRAWRALGGRIFWTKDRGTYWLRATSDPRIVEYFLSYKKTTWHEIPAEFHGEFAGYFGSEATLADVLAKLKSGGMLNAINPYGRGAAELAVTERAVLTGELLKRGMKTEEIVKIIDEYNMPPGRWATPPTGKEDSLRLGKEIASFLESTQAEIGADTYGMPATKFERVAPEGGAVTGALVGLVAGPIGAVVGGVIGYFAGKKIAYEMMIKRLCKDGGCG